MSSGQITQIIGAIIDVQFERNHLPAIYDALKVETKNANQPVLVLEVQQQLGDGKVRTIAMGSSEGLSRGMSVVNTGAPINVPVGKETLGRIMD
ncbi:MAG: F0F1 ATP synthase subunit beta, partial [Endozoicomonadaceae bacterium]|nr:F0F1 ATP synthase subunit beta [Endozoicomonadaceae bacterium]